MGSMVLGTVGAVIGFAVAGPTGAQWGFTIGSAIGSATEGPAELPMQQGPRLGDLKVQVSSFGAMIPFGYGTFRCAGNVIWSTPKRENATYTQVEAGGKGGGGTVQTQVSYYYTVSCAVALHDGEIIGIRKIWANGQLIYNVADVADANTVLASSEFARSVRIYTGTETQDPDPLIEAIKGVGNVPAYLGTAYVVFEDLVLTQFGNTLPSLEFEVVASDGSVELKTAEYINGTGANDVVNPSVDVSFSGVPLIGEVWAVYYNAGYYLRLYSLFTGEPVVTVPATAMGAASLAAGCTQDGLDAFNNAYGRGGSSLRINRVSRDGAVSYVTPSVGMGGYGMAVAADGQTIWATNNGGSGTIYRLSELDFALHTATQDAVSGGTFSRFARNPLGIPGRLYGFNGTRIAWVDPDTLAYTQWPNIGTIMSNWGAVIGTDGYVYVATSNTLGKYDADGSLVDSVTISGISNVGLVDADGFAWAIASGVAYKVQTSTMTVVESAPLTAPGYQSIIGEFTPGVPVVFGSSVNPYGRIGIIEPLSRISINPVPLDEVVADLCRRAGLQAADIDVTSLASSEITGYLVGRRTTVRSMIEPLMISKFFDAVESDGKIKFVKRGSASVRTLSEGRLGAREDDVTEARDTLTLVRRQDLELPVQINLVYMDANNSYQNGEQSSRRLLEGTIEPRTVEVPIVLTADEAKSIADTMLYVLWLARTTGSFVAGREQLALEPTDVITIPHDGQNLVFRLTKESGDPFGVLQFEAEIEDADIYTQNAPGTEPPVPVETVALTTPTQPVFLDIPLLRDVDNGAGFYFAAKGYTDEWSGTQLYRSLDGGGSFEPLNNGTLLLASVIGSAVTALADLTAHGNELIDEHHSVDVLVPGQTLSSVTRQQLLNGANAAVLITGEGPEVFQFRDAVLVATDTYRLTGLLRGRLGTESFMGIHVTGETFVLLNGNIRAITQTWGEVGRNLTYKAVSVNSTLQRTGPVVFRNTGIRNKPLAPIHLGGGRNAAGDLLLEWTRRTRLEASLRDNVDAVLGEASERYVVEILDGGDVVRTVPVLEQSLTYTAAEQTTDFGSPQASIDVVIYQLSETYGRGYPAAATF